ncbi:hypothetical protein GYMLUDRAFT_241911 [Collybiopsis luxurians FD-317 M1]|uniref:F-box domain-containing protein n=1 Tax=Collybiopsis luxurians FD-317 M1 TaxID=944289 RepID=A0A0D0CV05_9AGAR|nr:hypothetical protein GYMLUDRAFT_241911 [Collybiopsis luxurians FD-317 M1]
MQACSRCQKNVLKPRVELDFTSLHAILRSESGPASVQPDKINLILERLLQDLGDLGSTRLGIDAHQTCISEYAAQTRSLLSPIRKIPDEILQVIFDYCCDMNHFVVSRSSETAICNIRNKPALVLSSTCFRWRRNAVHMPTLWSRITLDWDWRPPVGNAYYGSKAYHERSFALVTFLNRSSQLPLAVNIIISGASSLHFTNGKMHPIATQLVEQMHRWKSLTFDSLLIRIENLIGESVVSKLPLLDDLELLDPSDNFKMFEDTAPRLKALRMPYSFPFRGNEPFTFPHLHHLELDLDQGFLNLFHHTPNLFPNLLPNLVSLEIGECVESEPARDIPSSVFSSLKTLLVRHGNIWSPASSAFPLFTFPSLNALHLKPDENFQPQPNLWVNIDLFMAFLERSSCPLTTLFIDSISLSDLILVRLLRHVPTLRDLTIIGTNIADTLSPITEQFIESLHASRTSSLRLEVEPLVPRLHSLTLDTGAITFCDNVVIDMVHSRWIPSVIFSASNVSSSTDTGLPLVDCLREFTMKFRNRRNPGDVYEPLDLIEKNGMRLVITWEK